MIFLLLSFLLSANSYVDAGTLTLKVNNIKSTKGTMRIALFQGEENFLQEGKELHPQAVEVQNNQPIQIEIPNVAYGTYALAIYHDVNNNGELDKNFMGIPSEPYSFSNNPKIKWRGPTYEGAKFTFQEDRSILELNLRKWSKQ